MNMTDQKQSSYQYPGKAATAFKTVEGVRKAFAVTMRNKAKAEAERTNRLHNEYVAFNMAEEEYKLTKTALELAIANDEATQRIAGYNATIDDLKVQAEEFYEPLDGLTHRETDGAGFQFRATVKTLIANEEMLARSLIEQHIWQDIGASLTVNVAKAAKILKTHTLPGLSVEPVVTVAAYGPSQPKEN
jgi:hypothetical protein